MKQEQGSTQVSLFSFENKEKKFAIFTTLLTFPASAPRETGEIRLL